MILLISTCSDKLSEEEFVRPIKELTNGVVKHYSELKEVEADKIIICGTALKDFKYLKADWSWLKELKKPVLGICAGYQVIARELGEELINNELIGVRNKHYFITSKLVKAKKVNELERVDSFTASFNYNNFTAYAYQPEVLNPELIIRFIKKN